MNEVIEDVYQLASEVIRKFSSHSSHQCNIAMAQAELMTDEDFIYTRPETPQYLEDHGLAEINSSDLAYAPASYWHHTSMGIPGLMYRWNKSEPRKLDFTNSLARHGINIRGLYAITFNVERLSQWFENETDNRLGSKELPIEKVPDGWKWSNEADGKFQFGELGSHKQGGDLRLSVFREAMNLFIETPQAISVKALVQRTGSDANRLRIELSAINTQLKKIRVAFKGSHEGYYRLVQLPLHS
jgi:hypothetical protein